MLFVIPIANLLEIISTAGGCFRNCVFFAHFKIRDFRFIKLSLEV